VQQKLEEGNQATITCHQLTPPTIAGRTEIEAQADGGDKALTHQLSFSRRQWQIPRKGETGSYPTTIPSCTPSKRRKFLHGSHSKSFKPIDGQVNLPFAAQTASWGSAWDQSWPSTCGTIPPQLAIHLPSHLFCSCIASSKLAELFPFTDSKCAAH